MNLLELIISEGVEWPEGANFVNQSRFSRDIHFHEKEPVNKGGIWYGSSRWASHKTLRLSSDHSTSVISKSEYVSAKEI